MSNLKRKVRAFFKGIRYSEVDPAFFEKPNSFEKASKRTSKNFSKGALKEMQVILSGKEEKGYSQMRFLAGALRNGLCKRMIKMSFRFLI